MGVGRSGKGTKELPEAMRRAVADAIEAVVVDRFKGKSERAIAKAMGISQPALNQIRNMKGALGVHALLALRAYTGRSIDELLGLEPMSASGLSPVELDLVRTILLKATAAPKESVDEVSAPVRARPSRRGV